MSVSSFVLRDTMNNYALLLILYITFDKNARGNIIAQEIIGNGFGIRHFFGGSQERKNGRCSM